MDPGGVAVGAVGGRSSWCAAPLSGGAGRSLVVIPLWIAAIMAHSWTASPPNLTGVIAGSLELAVPISLGAFAGILSERSGMLNIAIEGKFLVGAACGVVAASSVPRAVRARTSSACWRRCSSPAPLGLLLAWLGIRHKVDQIIAGIVINIGALGITNFLFLRVLSKNTELNTPPTIEAIQVPVLTDIPVLGPLLFSGTPYLYFTFPMFFLTYMICSGRAGASGCGHRARSHRPPAPSASTSCRSDIARCSSPG